MRNTVVKTDFDISVLCLYVVALHDVQLADCIGKLKRNLDPRSAAHSGSDPLVMNGPE